MLQTLNGRFLLVLALVSASLIGCGEQNVRFNATDITGANYGQDFELVDSHGQLRTLEDFRGEVVMIYFGFIQCPDVCPTALMRAVEVKDALGPSGDKFRVVYITVDPERDTPEIVSAYLAAFDPGFVGLHPTMEELPEVAKSFRVFYRKVPTGDSYTMDHTATSFVYDTQGRLRLAVSHSMEVAPIVEDVRTLLQAAR
ncbi:redoxin domain-containing protein [Azoarcus taiwanensis]|uniref:Redoxin domain-containing protein n=2 Tax=Azoarcus taiwanensis TaxID=666964 RepID=A0A972F9T8_9RHOO|nr:redoxin domain-containing protein [Azoarcus taiwanensis]